MLSTEQLHRLHFPSVGRARKRLSQLWQHGFVKRMTRPVRLGDGSSVYLYALAPKGVGLLAREASAPASRMRLPRDISEHSQRINDFRICLQLVARQVGKCTLVWRQGRDLKMFHRSQRDWSQRPMPIIPDAFFTIRSGDRNFNYFLEIDRGTTDLRRVLMKIRNYLQLWDDQVPQGKFNVRSFRVLFVTTSARRLGHMLALLRDLQSHRARVDLILFTTYSAYSIAEPQRLFRPIWQSLGAQGNINLCSLLPIPLPLPTTPGKPPV